VRGANTLKANSTAPSVPGRPLALLTRSAFGALRKWRFTAVKSAFGTKLDVLSFAGFPEDLKKASCYPIEFRAYAALVRAESVSERGIITTYEPQRDIRFRAAPELPDLGANLSGCSGGPLLMHIERNGLNRWFPVGLILRGPRASSDNNLREYDIFRFRRIHYVNADGTIRKDIGWLP
jgi:hypothetical protein